MYLECRVRSLVSLQDYLRSDMDERIDVEGQRYEDILPRKMKCRAKNSLKNFTLTELSLNLDLAVRGQRLSSRKSDHI